MALTKCPECQKDVSTKADACPHCGAKKSSGFGSGCFLISIVLIGFGGCVAHSLFQAAVQKSDSTSAQIEATKVPAGTQGTLAAALSRYVSDGVFTKAKSVGSDQVWLYVGQGFQSLTLDRKKLAVEDIYLNSPVGVEFIAIYDSYTGKSVGMYKPSYGLNLN